MKIQNELKQVGEYKIEIIRNNEVIDFTEKNIIVNQGLIYTLNTALCNGTPITQWYVGLLTNQYQATNTETLTTLMTNGVEFTGYNESTRQLANLQHATTSATVTNTGFESTFTVNTAGTISGAFLCSSSGKGSTTGTLFSSSMFNSSRSVLVNDIIKISYTTTSISY